MPPTAKATQAAVTPTGSSLFETGTPIPGQEQQAPTPEFGDLKVAYTSEERLYLWSDGSVKQLTSSGDVHEPRISPDGKIIAFLRTADEFHLELWAVNTDGSSERKLVSVADMDAIGGGVRDPAALAVNPYRFRWIPGTHQVAFNSQQVFQGPGLSLLNDLNLVEAETLEIQNLFLSGSGGEFFYSPDGKQVAITQPDKIMLSNADGSEYRTVFTYEPVTTYAEYRFYAMPHWSAQSDFMMVAIPPVDPLAQSPQATELWRIPNGEGEPELTGSVTTVMFQEQPVVFSPDLKRIAFLKAAGQTSENLRELHLATSDGQGDFIYAKAAPILFQSWSTDSIQFAYSTGLEPEAWIGSLEELPQAMDPAFNGAQGLRWTSQDQFLFWLPSGNAFELYLSTRDGEAVLLDTVFTTRPFLTFSP
jgi:dipeptidyl aminopeptidase/acylaminoacyl peptidase